MSKSAKKLIPYALILLILVGVGVFGAGREANAAEYCWNPDAGKPTTNTKDNCTGKLQWITITETAPGTLATPTKATTTTVTSPGSTLEKNLASCDTLVGDPDDCLVVLFYYLFYVIPTFLLNLVANLFNVIITLALSSVMYTAGFIAESWRVTRDLSNIFFILILLYIAIKVILNIGGSEAKKMIVNVIIMALLINFSMFMTKVVIDASNILALIFYNKINVETVITKDGKKDTRLYAPVLSKALGVEERDVSGGLVSKFDVTRFMTEDFFEKVRDRAAAVPTVLGAAAYVGSGAAIGSFVPVVGTGIGAVIGGVAYGLSFLSSPEVPAGLMIGIILITGLILFFATYAFFIASISFLGRLIELWVLIIFSPFAFMSFTIPKLKGMEYLGWDAWLKRLLKTSFMAPIFMFFLYFIFKIAEANIFENFTVREPKDQGMIEAMILVILPGLIILFLLLQATKFAKEGSGKLGEVIMKGASFATGIMGGLAIGGVAAGLQGTLGHAGKRLFESKRLADWETSKDSRLKRFLGGRLRTAGGGDDGKGGFAGSSFDLRKGVAGGALKAVGAATGLDLGGQSSLLLKESGGYEADLKRRDAKRKARADGLKIKEGEEEKQKLNQYEEEHQTISIKNEEDIRKVDLKIAGATKKRAYLKELFDSADKTRDKDGKFINPETENKRLEFEKAAQDVRDLEKERSDIKNGGFDEETGEYRTNNGKVTEDELINANMAAEAADAAKAAADAAAAAAPAAHAAAVAAKAAADAAAATAERDAIAAAAAARFTPSAANTAALDAANAVKAAADAAAATAETNVTNTFNNITTTVDTAREAETKATTAAVRANRANTSALGGRGNSQNKYEDDLLPEQKHKVEEVSKGRARDLADVIEKQFAWPWNKAARRKSAHEIRMGAKPEKSHGGGEHGFAGHLASDIVGAGIADIITHKGPGEKH